MIGEAIGRRFPTLTRHWSILKESWSRQNEADKQHRPRSDHEFLPAALEIIEKPASPGMRALLWVLCSLFTIAIAWACIGKVDVVAVASGKVVPASNVKVIQPLEIGLVRAIHVRNGQHVRKGQLLVELDPTLVGADEAQASRARLSADIIAARNDALLAHLTDGSNIFRAPAGTPADVVGTQDRFVRTSIAEYEAERAGLVQNRAEEVANLAGALAEIAKLQETLPLIDEQIHAREQLLAKGYYSRLKLAEYQQSRIEHVKDIDVQQANATKARAAIANIDAQIQKLRETFGKDAVTALSDASDKSALAAQDLRKAGQRRIFQQLRAPVDGTVQQLAIATVGGVVQPAQPLMVIVPEGSDIAVEVMIANRDIGFVHEGQPVRIKLEAFPFTDFGLVQGRVESVSRDAIEQNSQQPAPGQPQQRAAQPSLVYAARIRLGQKTLRIAGHDQPIGPGLAVQAEIKTGERRIIKYLLSPITQTLDEAGREK